MVFGMKSNSNVIRVSEGCAIGLVRSTSFGRKRVALSNDGLGIGDDEERSPYTSLKRPCFQDSSILAEKSALEALPQDLLIRILCGVEHDDLSSLFLVSRAIRLATITAKQLHFSYSTPRKMVGFRNDDVIGSFDEIEAPNAPKQSRAPRSRLSARKLAGISVALFCSDGDEEGWPRKGSFAEMETEI